MAMPYKDLRGCQLGAANIANRKSSSVGRVTGFTQATSKRSTQGKYGYVFATECSDGNYYRL